MRDYDPTTERYLQPDPLGLIDGASVYGYVRHSPMMLTDPTGECPWCAWLLLGAAEGVAIGYLLDLAIGDGCYTWEEFWFDATFGAILGLLGNYGKALKGARAGANGKGFASFLADEGGAASAKGAGKAAAKAAGTAAHNHYPVPKFMGGNAKQPLVQIAPEIHTGASGFHSQLNQALRKAFGMGGGGKGGSARDWADYFDSNPGAQRRAFDILLDVSRSFDATHGTSVTSGVWNSVVSGAFGSIP